MVPWVYREFRMFRIPVKSKKCVDAMKRLRHYHDRRNSHAGQALGWMGIPYTSALHQRLNPWERHPDGEDKLAMSCEAYQKRSTLGHVIYAWKGAS